MPSTMCKRKYHPSTSGETEDPERYTQGGLHPIHIGDYLQEKRYRIVHKLGYGSFSTNWLARDEVNARYVSLKIARADAPEEKNEISVLRHLAADQSQASHPGKEYVMKLLDEFIVCGPNGNHRCYVSRPAGRRVGRIEDDGGDSMQFSLQFSLQLIEALMYLQSLEIAHADIYPSNILLQLANFESWSEEEVYECLGMPVREAVQRLDGTSPDNTAPRYCVQRPDFTAFEKRLLINKVLLIDFGQAFRFEEPPLRIATPAQYSAPEVLYRRPLSPAIDKWALGCTIFELCSGYSLFKMIFNPRIDVMKDMVSVLGKPPDDMWEEWEGRTKYFEPDGTPKEPVGRSIPVIPFSLRRRVYKIGQKAPCYTDPAAAHDDENVPTSGRLAELGDLLQGLIRYDTEARHDLETAHAHPLFHDINTEASTEVKL